jgi:hypothetical protein
MWVLLGVDGGHLPSKYSGPKNRGHLRTSHRDLQIMIGAFRHKDRKVSRPMTIRDSGGFKDAHANPSVTVGPGGHVFVVSATRHKFEGRVYRSIRPHDHTAFEIVFRGYMAYPQIWSHANYGLVLLHTRYKGNKRFLYQQQSTDGRTWTQANNYAAFEGHYQNSVMDTDGTLLRLSIFILAA